MTFVALSEVQFTVAERRDVAYRNGSFTSVYPLTRELSVLHHEQTSSDLLYMSLADYASLSAP